MPEIVAIKQAVPDYFRGIFMIPMINELLTSHLEGTFHGAESRSIRICGYAGAQLGMSPFAINLIQFADLFTDIGKTGKYPTTENQYANYFFRSVYDLNHGKNPDVLTLSDVFANGDFNSALQASFYKYLGPVPGDQPLALAEEAFTSAKAEFLQLFNFTDTTTLREIYNVHVINSLEIFAAAWKELNRNDFSLASNKEAKEYYASVRKIIGLHHVYRGMIPEGMQLADLNRDCLIVMAADMYDAKRSRLLKGRKGSHTDAMISEFDLIGSIPGLASARNETAFPFDQFTKDLTALRSVFEQQAAQEMLESIYLG